MAQEQVVSCRSRWNFSYIIVSEGETDRQTALQQRVRSYTLEPLNDSVSLPSRPILWQQRNIFQWNKLSYSGLITRQSCEM